MPARVGYLAALFVVAVAAIGLILVQPPAPAPTPSGSPGASTLAADRSPGLTPMPTGSPATSDPPLGACELPATLPTPPTPVAAPSVTSQGVGMLFGASEYVRDAQNRIVPDDSTIGVWYVAPGASEATLLVSGEPGGALPLALSPAGHVAAVWYLPERRNADDPTCLAGIYLVPTSGGPSRLIETGEWLWREDGDGLQYGTRRTPGGPPRIYTLPLASFSADGRSLALIDPDGITIVGPGRDPVTRRHIGQCSSWAWSPEGSRFVAGCAEMTKAWTIDVDDGFSEATPAVPIPEGFRGSGGGWMFARIGITGDGDIRFVRFRANPCRPGASGPTCLPTGWSETTIDPITGRSRSFVHEADWWNPGGYIAMSVDASWLYAGASPPRVISIDSGVARKASRISGPISTAADGRRLFGVMRFRGPGPRYVVVSLNRTGARRDIATINWSDDADHRNRFFVYGLAISAPPS